jgi:hypothetical protein
MRLGAPFIRCITSRGGSTCAAAFGGEVPVVEGRARLVGAMKDETQPSIRKGRETWGKLGAGAEIWGGGWGEQMIFDRMIYKINGLDSIFQQHFVPL